MVVRSPRAGSLLGLALLTATVAGCGGSSAGNGVASKGPSEILASAEDVAEAATSVHVAGSIVSHGAPITFDLHLLAGRGGRGQLSERGVGFELVQAGKTVFIKGSRAFYSHIGGSAGARLLQGKWLKAPATNAEFASIAALTSLRPLIERTLADHGPLTKGRIVEVEGQRAITVADSSQGGALYVATSGPPFPLEIDEGGANRGTITFDRWNQPVSLEAPQRAVNLSQLRAR